MRNNRRFWEIMGGLSLIMIGLAALSNGGSATVPVMVGLAGFYLLARQFDRRNQEHDSAPMSHAQRQRQEHIRAISRARQQADEFDQPARPSSGAEQVYSHAIRAVRRAGLEPDDTQVLPVDVGVIALRAGRDPVVHRSQPVQNDADYIQPFVQLRLPTKASGRVRFEIQDSNGQVLYIHEDNHQLQRGRNLITPSSRLPVHDEQAMEDDWELHVSADGMLLAKHVIGWREHTERNVKLESDGELSTELRAAIVHNEQGSVSLDELLSFQDEPTERKGRR
jgi:hypothetical protein